ncbi:MAG: translesion error-prone DNA polymerase V autoproteolytic subunit [Ktedonobacteraceae bacterium]
MAEDPGIFTSIPMFPAVAHAGFPSPGDDYAESPLNLHDLIVEHPHATYFIRIKGDSMRGACIHAGDVVVVDRMLAVAHNAIVVARVGGVLLLKRVQVRQHRVFLLSDPAELPTIELTQQDDMELWGVVTHCVHRVG